MIKQNWKCAIAIIVILMLVFAFSGCGKKGDPVPTKDRVAAAIFNHRIVALNHQ